MPRAARGMPHRMPRAAFGMRHAACRMPHAACRTRHSACQRCCSLAIGSAAVLRRTLITALTPMRQTTENKSSSVNP